jgi:ribose transport system permease protein
VTEAHSSGTRTMRLAKRRRSANAWRRLPRFAALLRWWVNLVPIIALTAGFGVVAPGFLSPSNVAAIIEQSAIPVILATGLTFVVMSGAIDLSIEGVMATTSVAVALLVANTINHNDFGMFGVLLTIGVGVLFGVFNGWVNAYLRIPSFVVTLGTWSIGVGVGTSLLATFASNGNPGLQQGWLRDLALLGPLSLSNITLIAAVVACVGWWLQHHTAFGRRVVAIGGGEEIARFSGIPVNAYKIAVFAFAGALSGLAGVLTSARLGAGTVSVGADTLFTAITAVVIGGTPLSGGRGGVLQSVVGVLTLSILADGMILAGVPPFYQQAIKGLLILGALISAGWRLRQPLRVVK